MTNSPLPNQIKLRRGCFGLCMLVCCLVGFWWCVIFVGFGFVLVGFFFWLGGFVLFCLNTVEVKLLTYNRLIPKVIWKVNESPSFNIYRKIIPIVMYVECMWKKMIWGKKKCTDINNRCMSVWDSILNNRGDSKLQCSSEWEERLKAGGLKYQ